MQEFLDVLRFAVTALNTLLQQVQGLTPAEQIGALVAGVLTLWGAFQAGQGAVRLFRRGRSAVAGWFQSMPPVDRAAPPPAPPLGLLTQSFLRLIQDESPWQYAEEKEGLRVLWREGARIVFDHEEPRDFLLNTVDVTGRLEDHEQDILAAHADALLNSVLARPQAPRVNHLGERATWSGGPVFPTESADPVIGANMCAATLASTAPVQQPANRKHSR